MAGRGSLPFEHGARARRQAGDVERRTLAQLGTAVQACRACPLWQHATQAVFGDGPDGARVMLVGEQPGDVEDRAGRAFVGPAGRLLDQALEAAGIDRRVVYVTNVVKHFKWEPRGKRRIHNKPNAAEVRACQPWLAGEIRALGPTVVVCLGATAAQTLLGAQFRVTSQRGEWLSSSFASNVVATVHPSSILREHDKRQRSLALRRFVEDLMLVPKRLAAIAPTARARVEPGINAADRDRGRRPLD